MLSTTLELDTIRSNTGRTTVVAVIAGGDRVVLLGESDSIGRKRAILDVLRVDPSSGSGKVLERQLRRLEVAAGHRSEV